MATAEIKTQMERRLIALAEHYGLEWVNEVDEKTNPYGEVGYFRRKDGERSAVICVLDAAWSDEVRRAVASEVSKMLGGKAAGEPGKEETK